MSLIDLSNITEENKHLLTSEGHIDHFIRCSEDAHDKAENFAIVMNKARELGISEQVNEKYQKAVAIWGLSELWELPQTFERYVYLNPFPINALPGQLNKYIQAVTNYVQVFPEMAVLPLLSVLSLCVQGKAIAKHPGNAHTEPLNLYTLTIASPGERKTGSFKEFMKPVNVYVDNYNLTHKSAIDEYIAEKTFLESKRRYYSSGKTADLEQLKSYTKQLSDLEPIHPLKLSVSDVTPEALAWEMYLQGGNMGVLGDEGTIFDVLSGLYSGGAVNLSIFLLAYDGSRYSISRRTKEDIELKQPLLTMGIMAQPDVFNKAMENQVFSGRGFTQRFLYAFPESKVGYQTFTSENIPKELENYYNSLINKLLAIPKNDEPYIIKSDKEATKLFEDYNSRLQLKMRTGGQFEYLREWASKQFGRCLRIAGIFHLCEHEPTELLNADTAYKAIQVASWSEEHALKALSCEAIVEQSEKDALYVLSRIKENGQQELNKREILRLCRRLNAETIVEPLKILEDKHYIKFIEPEFKTKGRPPEKYKVNPYAFE